MTDGSVGDGGGSRYDDTTPIRELSTDRLREVVAATWRSSGWRVDAPTDDTEAELLVATRGSDGGGGVRRRLLHVLEVDRQPSGPGVRRAVELMRRHDADSVVVVSAVEFGPTAVAVADAYGVDLVGPTALARAVDEPSGVDERDDEH